MKGLPVLTKALLLYRSAAALRLEPCLRCGGAARIEPCYSSLRGEGDGFAGICQDHHYWGTWARTRRGAQRLWNRKQRELFAELAEHLAKNARSRP